MNLITLKELTVYGTYAQKTEWWIRSLELLGQKKISLKPLISNIYRLEDWEQAFDGYIRKIGLKYLLAATEERR